jgi:hypothetical protein
MYSGESQVLHPCSDCMGCYPPAGSDRAGRDAGGASWVLPGAVVALATLPGFLAPFVTGLLVQTAGRNAMQGLQSAYILASLLLLVSGVIFTTVVRPDEAIRTLKTLGSAPERA